MSINEVKDKIKSYSISNIIGQYIPLTKRGQNSIGLCPFHEDRNPSLSVNDNKGLFMCFVCQTGGDAITFVEKFRGLEFKEAIVEIGQKIGFPIQLEDLNRGNKNPKIEMAQKILKNAAKIYFQHARNQSPNKFSQFIIERKLTEKTADDFQIGLAPPQNVIGPYLDSIRNEDEKNFAKKVALEIGILKPNEQNGTTYDHFRDRIIFPIWDYYGAVVGFGSRRTTTDQKAKYLNSVESFIFNKRNILYGLNIAKSEIRSRDRLILVEGYMDCIALHQQGFKESVACMGISLGASAIQMIKGMTKNIFLALDSDQAGHLAMERMNHELLSQQILPRLLDFSPHKDPDEYLLANSSLAFIELMENAPLYIDTQLDKLKQQVPQDIDEKLKRLEEGFKILAPLGNQLIASEKIIRLAKDLSLQSDSAQIVESYLQFIGQNKSKNDFQTQQNSKLESQVSEKKKSEISTQKPAPITVQEPLSRIEKILMQEVVQHPVILAQRQITEVLDFLKHSGVKVVFRDLIDLYREVDVLEFKNILREGLLRKDYPVEIKEIIGAALFKSGEERELTETLKEKLVFDIVKKLKLEHLKQKKIELKKRQQENLNEKEQEENLVKLNEVDRMLSQLQREKRLFNKV